MKILIKNVEIVTVNENMDILKDSFIYICENRIRQIGSMSDLEEEFCLNHGVDKVIDADKKVCMPGFINMHTHVPMSILRNYADDVCLEEWLEDRIWPIEDKLTRDDIRLATRLSILEMIKSGTTLFNDMYYELDLIADEVEKSGVRAVIGRGMTSSPTKEEEDEKLEYVEKFYKDYVGKADGRIMSSVAPHAVYTNSLEFLKRQKLLSDKLNSLIHLHLSESKTELENCLKEHGKSPVKVFDDLGLLNERTICAHSVWLDDEDIEILKERRVSLVHNPASNMKLASGFMRTQELLDKGINVCLGTDGVASNNNVDMFQDMYLAALIAKGNTLDPTAVSAESVLRMATINGAKALGLEKELGSIEEGKLADLILIDFDNPHHYPNNDVVAALVYSTFGSDVDTVIADGNILMENRIVKTIDEKDTERKIQEHMEKLLAR